MQSILEGPCFWHGFNKQFDASVWCYCLFYAARHEKHKNTNHCKICPTLNFQSVRFSRKLSGLNLEGFLAEALKLDEKLRYIAIVDRQFHVLACRTREGITPMVSGDQQRDFLSIATPIVAEAVEKVESFLGRVRWMGLRYEKYVSVATRTGNLFVILGFDPDVETPFMTRIIQRFEKLNEYLA